MGSGCNVIGIDQPHLDIERGAEMFSAIVWLDYGKSSSIDEDMLRPLHRSLLEPKPLVVEARAKDGLP